jgi:hypothetical protein
MSCASNKTARLSSPSEHLPSTLRHLLPLTAGPRIAGSGLPTSTLDRDNPVTKKGGRQQALARSAVSAHSVAHLLDQRARARRTPPPLAVVLPDDPRVRDLRVTPHSLADYDGLLSPPPAVEVPDEPPA